MIFLRNHELSESEFHLILPKYLQSNYTYFHQLRFDFKNQTRFKNHYIIETAINFNSSKLQLAIVDSVKNERINFHKQCENVTRLQVLPPRTCFL